MKARGKTFLNEAYDENGHIKWEIKAGKDVDYRGEVVSGSLLIADCNDTVCLCFDCETVPQIDKRIDKVTVLIKELSLLREALELAKKDISKKNKFYY